MKKGVAVLVIIFLMSMPLVSASAELGIVDWLVDWWHSWTSQKSNQSAGRATSTEAVFAVACSDATNFARKLGATVPPDTVLYNQQAQRDCLAACYGPCKPQRLGLMFPTIIKELTAQNAEKIVCWVCNKPKIQCVANQGADCNRNACGGTGKVLCDGSCSTQAIAMTTSNELCGCGGTRIATLCSGVRTLATDCTRGDCPTGQVCQNGQCCSSQQGQACNRNSCGGTGTIQCNGQCSGLAPVIPSNLGQACGCGGTIQCNGQCSKPDCTSGQVCQNGQCCSSQQGQTCNRNACGGTGTIQCDGTCSTLAPTVPSNLGQACGCGGTIQCDGQCSKGPCPTGQVCQNGQCITPCSSQQGQACGCGGTIQCNGQCSASGCSGGQICQNGQCITPCSSQQGQACNRNACGGTGTIQCNGQCSSSEPYYPWNLGQSCGCGGTIQCSGQCSASDCPGGQICQYGQCVTACSSQQGQACNRNSCGGSGTIQCDGSCSQSAPYQPSNLGQACGCGGTIQCNGQCSRAGCSYGYSCVSGQCVYQQAPSACPGSLGCCCGFNRGSGWLDCGSAYECRGWNVPGHQSFGTCTLRGQMYAAQLASGEPAYCGR